MASTPLTAVVPPQLAARAAALNVRTVADLLLAPPFELGEDLDAGPDAVAAARRAAAAAVVPSTLPTLLDLVTAPRPAGLPCGLPTLDAALRGGLRPGALTEIVGGAGAGKTQLALAAAARALALRPDAGVVWVDAEGAFSAARLAEVAGGSGVDVGAALADRTAILPSPPGGAAALITTLDALATAGGVGGRRLALLVLDSAPAALARGDGAAAAAPPDPATVADLARALKRVAEACAAVVLATNQVVAGAGGRGAAVAALGAGWAHAVSARIALEREAGGGRWARLVKAPAAGDAAAQFEVGAAGVVETEGGGEPPPRPPWADHEGGVLDAPLWAGAGGGVADED